MEAIAINAEASSAAPGRMPRRSLYRRLLPYLRPYVWPHFVLAIACMLVFSATNGAMPVLVRYIFDDVFSGRQMALLRILPAVIIAVFVVRGLAGFWSTYLTEYVGQHLTADLRNHLNRHIQTLPLAFFNQTPTATIVSRITNDVAFVRLALTDSVASLLKDASSLVILVAVAIYQDWLLALIAFVVFPAAVWPVLMLSRRLRTVAYKGQASIGKISTLLQEAIQGHRVVKAFAREQYEADRFAAENARLVRLGLRSTTIRAVTNPMMELLAAFGIAGVVWYGGYSVSVGARTQGAFLAFLTALFLLYQPFKRLATTGMLVQQALGAAERVVELLDTPSEVDARRGRTLDRVQDAIRFEHVGFRYEREPVLHDISLEIRRGEVVALVGVSGGGKSTLADLLLRFYDPTEGRITIDGVDLREYALASLRAQMALVTQHTFLFNDTARDNIAYGDAGGSPEAIVAAARAAHAHEFIAELPSGYDTVVGELGVKLSGGQRQRLAIARALLKDAPILVLDEATSALDNESEHLVQRALETLMRNRTTLVIAHRLSTIRRATRIVVVVDGRIAEQGTQDELLALNGEYRKLYDLQFDGGPEPAPGIEPAADARRPPAASAG